MGKVSAAFLAFLLAADASGARPAKIRAASNSSSRVSGTYAPATGKYAPVGSVVVVSGTPAAPAPAAPAACGAPAASTDMEIKRKCAVAYGSALGIYCGLADVKCVSAFKAAMDLNFGLDYPKDAPVGGKISDISVDLNGTPCNGAGLDRLCSNFADELVAGLWDLYSDKAIAARKTCNYARARFMAAQNCFAYIMSNKNDEGIGGFFSLGTDEQDNGLNFNCGSKAVIDGYNAISLDPYVEALDSASLFRTNATAEHTGSGEKLETDIATAFAGVGRQNWNWTAQIGNLLDLTWDFRSASAPRELTTLANSFITDGETACGSSFRTDMQATDFKLENRLSLLEREIQKKGLLKGLFDYTLDNFVAPIAGTDKTGEIKGKGIIGSIRDAGKNKDKLYDSNRAGLEAIGKRCADGVSSGTYPPADEVKTKITDVLEKLAAAITALEANPGAMEHNYPAIQGDLTLILGPVFRESLPEKLKGMTIPAELTKKNIGEFKALVATLKKVDWKCSGEPQTPQSRLREIQPGTYDLNFTLASYTKDEVQKFSDKMIEAIQNQNAALYNTLNGNLDAFDLEGSDINFLRLSPP